MYLATTNTLRAKAGTATAITYTVFADEVASGADAYSPVAQGQLAATTTTIYTAPSSTQTIITEIQLANTTASPVTGVTFYLNGTASTNQINGGFTIPANGSAVYRKDNGFTIYDSGGAVFTNATVTLTGDVTGTGTSNITTTLATVNTVTPGTFGSATATPVITVNGKGLTTASAQTTVTPAVGSITGLGTGVATALGNNVGSAGAPVTFNGAGGTPSSITLTNGTGLPTTGLTGTLQAAQEPAHTGDVTNTAGSLTTALTNIPNDTTQAGDLLATAITAPATPASGKARVYVDSTTLNLAVKNSVGTVKHAVITKTAVASNFLTAVADDGTISAAQPAATDVTGLAASATTDTTNASNISSGTLAVGRLPAFTGDVTEAIGTGVTKVVAIQNASVDSTAPTNGQVLQYVTGSPSKYIPFSYAGDVTGGPSASNVVALQNRPVSSTTPTTSQIIQYNSGGTWTPTTREFNVVSYGADPTGSSNSATAIQNAVNAAQTAAYSGGSGAIVWFPPGRYLIGSTIVVTGNNITLMGAGGGTSTDFGNYSIPMASHLVPQSAIKAVQVLPVQTNGLTGAPNYGFKWKGLGVDNYANAGTMGLQLISCQNFEIDDFYAINSTSVGLDFNTLPATLTNGTVGAWPLSGVTITVLSTAASGTGAAFASSGSFIMKDGAGVQRVVTYTSTTGTTFVGCSSAGAGSGTTATNATVSILPGAQDTTRGRVVLVNFRQIDGGGASGVAMQLNGDTSGVANTNLINFVGPVKISHANAAAIKDINSDTNYYDTIVINRTSGGTGLGADIGAGSTVALASRNNVFNHASFGAGGLTVRGTPTATFPSGPTRVMNYQLANGEALPTVETGAILQVNYNGGISPDTNTGNAVTTTTTLTGASATVIIAQLKLPPNGLQLGTTFRCRWPMSKTAAGTVARISGVKIGAAGTSADATVSSVTRTPTAVVDNGWEEIVITITALGASATTVMSSTLHHAVTATGLSSTAGGVTVTTAGTPVTFNSVTSGFLFLSFFMSSGAASTEVITILPPVIVEVLKAGNT